MAERRQGDSGEEAVVAGIEGGKPPFEPPIRPGCNTRESHQNMRGQLERKRRVETAGATRPRPPPRPTA